MVKVEEGYVCEYVIQRLDAIHYTVHLYENLSRFLPSSPRVFIAS